MKRVAIGLAILAIVAAGAGLLRGVLVDGPVYSVPQVDAALRQRPATVVGRVIRVRGVVGFCPVLAGCPPNVPPILSAQLGPPSPDPPLQLGLRADRSLLARLRGIPLLGPLLPPPAHLIDGYQGVLRVRIEPVPLYACFERLCYEGELQDMAPP